MGLRLLIVPSVAWLYQLPLLQLYHLPPTSVKPCLMYPSAMQQEERYGIWLKKRRTDLGLTQRQLASQIGVDKSYISKIENGQIDRPTLETRQRIEGAMGFGKNVNLSRIKGVDGVAPIVGDRESRVLVEFAHANEDKIMRTANLTDQPMPTDEELKAMIEGAVASWSAAQKGLLLKYIEIVSASLERIDPSDDE